MANTAESPTPVSKHSDTQRKQPSHSNKYDNRNILYLQKWFDYQMRWNPVHFGDIKQIRVSPDKVWLPDIVLFNK